MYSPKISEDMIPYLYREAKEQKVSMTRVVDQIVRKHVKKYQKKCKKLAK